jgi:hypothetical protein
MDWPPTGPYGQKVNRWVKKYNIDLSHFQTPWEINRKYPLIEKECPVCGNKFQTSKGAPKEKKTCGHRCANTFCSSIKGWGNYKHGGYSNGGTDSFYRVICFEYWPRKCALCNWTKIIDVHHIDGDNTNNNPLNLVPLCPNHHALCRLQPYKKEINEKIKLAIKRNSKI